MRNIVQVSLPRTQATGALKLAGPLSLGTLFLVSLLGYFKGTILVTWMGFDPTVILFSIFCVVVLAFCHKSNFRASLWWPLVLMFIGFVPGVVSALYTEEGRFKSAYLFSITLVVCVGAILMLVDARSWKLWVNLSVGAAILMVAVVFFSPDSIYETASGRLTGEGTSSISAARILMAGVVVLIVRAMSASPGVRIASISLAAALTMVGVQAGSKGPVVGGIVAVGVVALVARRFKGGRLGTVVFFVAAAAIGAMWISRSSSTGAARIVSFLAGDTEDSARPELWRAAIDITIHQPLGVGWGGYTFSEWLPLYFKALYPHNLVLEVFAEGGVLAGLALVVFVTVCLRSLWRTSDSPIGVEVFALAVYWLVVAQVSSDINGNRASLVALAIGLSGYMVRFQAPSPSNESDPKSVPIVNSKT